VLDAIRRYYGLGTMLRCAAADAAASPGAGTSPGAPRMNTSDVDITPGIGQLTCVKGPAKSEKDHFRVSHERLPLFPQRPAEQGSERVARSKRAMPPQNPVLASPISREFAELAQQVRGHDLLARRRGYYAIKIAATAGALVALAAAAVIIGNSWWNIAVAGGISLVLTQLGFIAHDAGHRQICTRRGNNDAIGLVHANLFTGFSYGWWISKHNRHHAYTNRPEKDPDMSPGALVYTPEQAAALGRFGRSFARVQAFMLVPLLFFEAFNLHVASIVSLARRHNRRALLEAGLLAVHAGVFFVAPFFILSPLRAVTFIAVMQLLFGFHLGATFVTNHVGMPALTGDDELGFLRRQVVTSRNLSCSPLMGFFFGGLDTQIEHHLFPTMPRANLRRARMIVRPFCDQLGIAYVEQRPHSAFHDVFRGLGAVGSRRALSASGAE